MNDKNHIEETDATGGRMGHEPVFPTPDSHEGLGSDGMTMRDYFAAQAPAEIPEWFKAEPTRERPTIPSCEGLPPRLQEKAKSWLADSAYDFIEAADGLELVVFQNQVETARREIYLWEREQVEARYFAWRWYYADMMLAMGEEDTE